MHLEGRAVRLGASVTGSAAGVHAVRYNFVPESLERRDASLRVAPDGAADLCFGGGAARYTGAASAARPCDFALLPDPEVPGGLVLERVESTVSVRAVRNAAAPVGGETRAKGVCSVFDNGGAEIRTRNAGPARAGDRDDDEFADLERDLLDDLGA